MRFDGGSAKGLILKSRDSMPTLRYEPPKSCVRLPKASAQVENEGVRLVFLQVGDQEIQQERLARPGTAENDGVGHVPVVEVQEVRRVMAGFENREIFLLQMPVFPVAGVQA